MRRIDRIDGALAVALGFSLAWSAHACAEPAPAPAPVDASSPEASSHSVDAPAPEAAEPVLLGRYTTTFPCEGKHAPRAQNIARVVELLACGHWQLLQGDIFYFNEQVGRRTEDRGFVPAPAIFMGEVADDIGGGTCQVSSTLHAAAIVSGLDIEERSPHSRPSKYIPKGLDATVSCPEGKGECKPELALKSPYPWAVTCKAEIGEAEAPADKALTISFYGAAAAPRVDIRWKGAKPDDSWTKKFHKTGKIRTATYKKRVQEGAAGLAGVLEVTRIWQDGRIDLRRFTSNYRPVDEVWEVGLDWDMTQNPWDPPAPP